VRPKQSRLAEAHLAKDDFRRTSGVRTALPGGLSKSTLFALLTYVFGLMVNIVAVLWTPCRFRTERRPFTGSTIPKLLASFPRATATGSSLIGDHSNKKATGQNVKNPKFMLGRTYFGGVSRGLAGTNCSRLPRAILVKLNTKRKNLCSN